MHRAYRLVAGRLIVSAKMPAADPVEHAPARVTHMDRLLRDTTGIVLMIPAAASACWAYGTVTTVCAVPCPLQAMMTGQFPDVVRVPIFQAQETTPLALACLDTSPAAVLGPLL